MAEEQPQRIAFAMVRVDDRLLHGQVLLDWVRRLRPRRIAVADDSAVDDVLARSLWQAAMPAEIVLWVGALREAAVTLAHDISYPPGVTMVLLRAPLAARALYEAGLHYAALNVGSVGLAAGRRRVYRQISLSAEELEALQYLASQGVQVTLQAAPSDPSVRIETLTWRGPSSP